MDATPSTDKERIIAQEIRLEYIADLMDRLEKKVDDNQKEIIARFDRLQCPSPRCNLHGERLDEVEDLVSKFQIYFYFIGTILSLTFAGFTYWLFDKFT